ncbi:hypothetical protein MBLNU230_g6736t1 [Neophaeotheca triangularis]
MIRSVAFVAACSALAGISNAARFTEEEYDSGAVHEMLMGMKMAQWDAEIEAGTMESSQYPELGYTKCIDGFAEAIPGDQNNTFQCNNIDLYHFLPHSALGSTEGQGSSSWGWTDPESGREFVAIGQYDGTAFAEITSEGKMSYLGRLPQYDDEGSRWREIRIVNDLMVVGSEAIHHGVQFFDMKKVLDLNPESPTTFTQEDLTGHWDELPIGRTHNIVVNHELNYAVAVGSVGGNETVRVRGDLPCRGGLIWLDISDPTNPTSPGCAAGDGYVHDAECVVYHGPDKRYEGRDICYSYNEDTMTIYDATDKVGNTTNIISRTGYPGAEYVHQGVVNNLFWQEYIFIDDEFDERDATVGPMTQGLPTTHIFDIRDLEQPYYSGNFAGRKRSIDHNQYVTDGFLYQSNYGNGLNVWDIRSVPKDPSGDSVCEAGYFDIYPEDDELEGGGEVAFLGSWSSYALFKSGFILIHTIERGSFIVKMTSKDCPKPAVCDSNACLSSLRASNIEGRLEAGEEFCSEFLARKYDDGECKRENIIPEYAAEACPKGASQVSIPTVLPTEVADPETVATGGDLPAVATSTGV